MECRPQYLTLFPAKAHSWWKLLVCTSYVASSNTWGCINVIRGCQSSVSRVVGLSLARCTTCRRYCTNQLSTTLLQANWSYGAGHVWKCKVDNRKQIGLLTAFQHSAPRKVKHHAPVLRERGEQRLRNKFIFPHTTWRITNEICIMSCT